jgi:hypothetical protein
MNKSWHQNSSTSGGRQSVQFACGLRVADDNRTSTGNICGSPHPVTGIASLLICRWCSYRAENTFMGILDLLRGKLYFTYLLYRLFRSCFQFIVHRSKLIIQQSCSFILYSLDSEMLRSKTLRMKRGKAFPKGLSEWKLGEALRLTGNYLRFRSPCLCHTKGSPSPPPTHPPPPP